MAGYRLRRVWREGDVAIFEQVARGSGKVEAWEVVRVRVRAPVAGWGETEKLESYPGMSAWGKDGFTCLSLEDARRRAARLRRGQ